MSIGVGIVGYGAQFSMGMHHCNAVTETDGLHVAAVFDVLDERRQAARAEQPGATVFDTYGDLLASQDVSLVVLVTPHDTHAPLSIEASNANKHVMTEKVMCLNTTEADAMIAAARKADKVLTVYQNRRWDGDYLTVRENIGKLGRLFQIETSVNGWWFPGGWRGVKAQGGGMLYDWGAHLADQLVQLTLPARPISVFATSHHGVHDVDIETQTTATIQFDSGLTAQIDVGCMSHITRPRWLIRGEDGALLMQDWEHCRLKTPDQDHEVAVLPSQWPAIYKNVSNHLNLGEELAVKPEEARIAVSIIEAAFESAATGAVVAPKP